jgi:hypothetical protein
MKRKISRSRIFFTLQRAFFLFFYLFKDSLPEGILTGPNVCERDELREEVVRVMEQELVETTVKEWCWPKIRCTKTKMEAMPVEKVQKMVKPHRMRYCCEGSAQNFMGNRCIPYRYEDDQQIVGQNNESNGFLV